MTLWTVAHQPPLSIGVSMQEYWSGLPYPPPGNLPDPGIKPCVSYVQLESLKRGDKNKCVKQWKFSKW